MKRRGKKLTSRLPINFGVCAFPPPCAWFLSFQNSCPVASAPLFSSSSLLSLSLLPLFHPPSLHPVLSSFLPPAWQLANLSHHHASHEPLPHKAARASPLHPLLLITHHPYRSRPGVCSSYHLQFRISLYRRYEATSFTPQLIRAMMITIITWNSLGHTQSNNFRQSVLHPVRDILSCQNSTSVLD